MGYNNVTMMKITDNSAIKDELWTWYNCCCCPKTYKMEFNLKFPCLMSVFAGCAVLELAWKERLSGLYDKIFCYCFPEKYGKCFDVLSETSLLLFLSKYNLKFL